MAKKRSLLVFLSVSGSATAFAPRYEHSSSSWLLLPPKPSISSRTVLSVSKKEKEGRAKAAAVEERLQLKARNELCAGLREEQRKAFTGATTKPATIAKAVRKLLHSADHDGLKDIGDEARVLAAGCYVASGRPGDAIPLITAVSNMNIFREDPSMAYTGLEVNSVAGKWDAAASFAEILYQGTQPMFDVDTTTFFGRKKDDVHRLVIQSYSNANRNIDVAIELIKSGDESTTTHVEYNAVLASLLRSGRLQEARKLYADANKVESSSGTSSRKSDAETHRLALSIAASLADIQLAMDAWQMLRATTSVNPTQEEIANALQSCQHLHETNSTQHEAFARDLVCELGNGMKKATVETDGVADVFSYLLACPKTDTEDTLKILDASKLVRTKMEWPEWLSKESRAKVLPALEQRSADSGRQSNDALKVFHSLQLTPKTLSDYAFCQSDFWSTIFRLSMEEYADDDNIYNVMKSIISDRYPLNDDDKMMKHRLIFLWVRYHSRCDISASEAKKDARQLLSDAAAAHQKNLTAIVPLTIDCACFLMRVDGNEGDVDELNLCYYSEVSKNDIPDVQKFELMECHFFSLYKAYRKNGAMDEVYELLFPNDDFASREVADVPLVGGIVKSVNFLESFGSRLAGRSETSFLENVLEQAILCDESTREPTYAEDFVKKYHEAVEHLWRDADALIDFFACEFPAVPSNSLRNPSKIDWVKRMLWGERCRTILLDSLKEGDCEEGWMRQTGGIVEKMGICLNSLYRTNIFDYDENIQAQYKEVRKKSVKRIVELLFESQLAMVATSVPRKKRKKSEKRQENLDMWTRAAEAMWFPLFQNLCQSMVFRNKNSDARDFEAADLTWSVLRNHPSVKAIDKEELNSRLVDIMERNSNPTMQIAFDFLDRAGIMNFGE